MLQEQNKEMIMGHIIKLLSLTYDIETILVVVLFLLHNFQEIFKLVFSSIQFDVQSWLQMQSLSVLNNITWWIMYNW